MAFVPVDRAPPPEKYAMPRLNSNHHLTNGGEKNENGRRNRSTYSYNHSVSGGGGGERLSRCRRREGGRAAPDGVGAAFGEFHPQSLADDITPEITTPQIDNKRQNRYREAPQSRIRFADDTRLSPARPPGKEVLVLGGGNQDPRCDGPAPSASNTPEATTANLDFSMITTPGGKQHARVAGDYAGFITPSEPGGGWAGGTPLRSILRGVVSSTPGIDPRRILATPNKTPYTAARESLTQTPGNTEELDESNGECTALSFARSAPLSGYLRKLGKNIPTFKRRFFVLKPSTHLYYFVSPTDVEPRGCIDLDTARDEGGGGGCEVREIGALPDGTFRFELLFDEEDDGNDDNASTDTGSRASSSQNSKRRSFQRRAIVLEARTEEMGREWMEKLQSERLSTARDETERLRASLAEMTSISARWETSACEDAMRADRAERQRNTAIAEARGWEGKFTDLNEAIRLLVKNNAQEDPALLKNNEEGGAPSSLEFVSNFPVKDNTHEGSAASKDDERGGAPPVSEFLTDSLAGLDVKGTYFRDISRAFQKIHNDYNLLSKKEKEASARIAELERRASEAESRAVEAESELANVWEDNRLMQGDLKKARREKKILVKEVRSWHATAVAEENSSRQSKQSERQRHHCDDASCKRKIDGNQQHCNHHIRLTNSQAESSKGGMATSHSGAASSSVAVAQQKPKRKMLNDEEKRLVIELEEHVMSGLRLSEQFLTLNGIDPSEVGDDLDDSVPASMQASMQASKSSVDKSPERQSNACGFSPQKPLLDPSTPPRVRASNAGTTRNHYVNNPLGSLFDESEEVASVSAGVESPDFNGTEKEINSTSYVNDDANNMSYTADSTQGSILLNDIHQYGEEASGSRDSLVNQNLNERFREQMTPLDAPRQREPTSNHSNAQPTLHTKEDSSNLAHPPPLDLASSILESSRSRVENGNLATAKLECPLKDVGRTPLPKPSNSTMGDNSKVYHITFFSKKIGLQFQKVPNEAAKFTGLLTEAVTADHGPNVESNQIAAELRHIASISHSSQNARYHHDKKQATECLPVAPDDAVLVCGFAGFDSSTGNCRPRIGARLVAFDGMTVEVGQWTFESIRKSIQARGRPLTLSFRNDFLTQKQREILTRAIDDVKPPVHPPSAAHPHHLSQGSNSASSQERYQGGNHGNTTYTASTTSSSLSSLPSQPPKSNKYYSSFSEAGSSISLAVAPLVSNLLSNSRSSSGKQQANFAPDYLRRTSDSLDHMRHHHDFQSGLL